MRRFLFLQGPHGPFFANLARVLRASGANVDRILFNRGDRLFWRGQGTWFTGEPADWPGWIKEYLKETGVTDIVLYGDTRPVHEAAVPVAQALGLRIHVFEEGYLRPWWVSYERGGSNGHSPLLDITQDQIELALRARTEPVEAPEGWGALYRHMTYGALYHAAILSGGPRQPTHRCISIRREAALNALRLVLLPVHALQRRLATRRLVQTAAPYHLVLLQLDHDANFRHHGPFSDSAAFIDTVVEGFAAGAPVHHHLVFKAHPLEDGRVPLNRMVRRLARAHGVAGRIHFVPGGKLGRLLDGARTAVTVNSTAAQQALFRGIPVKAFGRSVYSREEFVSGQSMPAFYASPTPPERAAYADFRQFLLETSQVPGSFYSARGRRQVCRRLVDMMLAEQDPYTARLASTSAEIGAAGPQHLALVRHNT